MSYISSGSVGDWPSDSDRYEEPSMFVAETTMPLEPTPVSEPLDCLMSASKTTTKQMREIRNFQR